MAKTSKKLKKADKLAEKLTKKEKNLVNNLPPKLGKTILTAVAASKKAPIEKGTIEIPIKLDKDIKDNFPSEFPFWGRLKIGKNRTTLVIDEAIVKDKKTKKMVDGFWHREATHTKKGNEYEEIKPNPDTSDNDPMYLKRPQKIPKKLVKTHNKNLNMPDELKKRYEKNNKK